MLRLLTIAALAAAAVEAHFELNYPFWRGDSFGEGKSQWAWPCANVTQETSSTNRTAWPLDGGSLSYTSSHHWVQAYVNLGIGDEVTGFTYTLLAAYNVTGNGTVCFPKLDVSQFTDANITEGTTASLQVVNVGDRGNALYNCADIVFTANATILSGDQCQNSTGVGGYEIESYGPNTTTSEAAAASGSAAASATSSGGAGTVRVGAGALVGAAALAFGGFLV